MASSSAEQAMALKVMNKILGKSTKTPKSSKKRESKREAKEEKKMDRQVTTIIKHQDAPKTPAAIGEAVFNPSPKVFRGETPVVALDCEMVGVESNDDALARVSIINYNGHVLMDKYVRPDKRVTDFRSWVSGVHPWHLKEENGAISFQQAKEESHRILKDKVICGHSLNHDFRVLDFTLQDEEKNLRDFTRFTKYKNQFGQVKSLKNLSLDLLGRKIQQGEHSSVIDGQASMGLYRLYEKDWEAHIKQKVYSSAKKRAEQDVQDLRKMNAFVGKPEDAANEEKLNKKQRFKKSFQNQQEVVKKPKLTW